MGAAGCTRRWCPTPRLHGRSRPAPSTSSSFAPRVVPRRSQLLPCPDRVLLYWQRVLKQTGARDRWVAAAVWLVAHLSLAENSSYYKQNIQHSRPLLLAVGAVGLGSRSLPFGRVCRGLINSHQAGSMNGKRSCNEQACKPCSGAGARSAGVSFVGAVSSAGPRICLAQSAVPWVGGRDQ